MIVIGTSARVSLANKRHIDIAIRGHASHSSTPRRGLDAIAGAHEVIDRLYAFDLGQRKHHGLENATLAPTSIKNSPDATNMMQGEVRMAYYRHLLSADAPVLLNLLLNAVEAVDQHRRLSSAAMPTDTAACTKENCAIPQHWIIPAAHQRHG